MIRFLLTVIVVICLCCSAQNQWAAEMPPTWGVQPAVSNADLGLDAAADKAPTATRSFKTALEKAAVDAYKAKQISRWDLARIRMALTFRPQAMAECQSCVVDQACSDGLMRGPDAAFKEGFDWNALLEFIKQLLPLILEIIKIFSV